MTMGAFLTIALAAAAAAFPAAAQQVSTGTTDWDKLPAARMATDDLDYGHLVRWVQQELQNPACQAKGMRPKRFDVDEPYAVLVGPDGSVSRIIVREMGCPGLNTAIGSTVADLAKRGRFRPTGQSVPLWYGGRLSVAYSDTEPR